jgi:NAD(P)H dehydrogenase (quinone)
MIAVTGATGKLGRLVMERLLARVPANELVAVVRSPESAADLATRGVQVRRGDYEDPASLNAALAGTDRLLFISGSEVGRRVAQHQAVVNAARAAGVKLLAYTSILNADTTGIGLAAEHKATEAMIRASGVPFVFLRHGWYLENYTETLGPALGMGMVFGAAGEGRVAPATRADLAEAAAVVITGDGHAGKVYELAGDESFTLSEFAAAVSRWAGKPIGYTNLPEAAFAEALVGAGLPEPFARTLADADVGIARGDLTTASGDLRRLIGRPTQTLEETLAKLPQP